MNLLQEGENMLNDNQLDNGKIDSSFKMPKLAVDMDTLIKFSNVSPIKIDENHKVFEGHFPGNPILPGVMTIEIIANSLKEKLGSSFSLLGIGKAKFIGMVKPGNTLTIDLFSIEEKEGNYEIKLTARTEDLEVIKDAQFTFSSNFKGETTITKNIDFSEGKQLNAGEYLPHREPIILVDKVSISDCGTKARANRTLLGTDKGYFGKLMPSELMIEGIAQTGATCLLSREEFEGMLPMITGVSNVKILSETQLQPGDNIEFFVELGRLKKINGIAMGTGKGYAVIDNKKIIETGLNFVLTKNN